MRAQTTRRPVPTAALHHPVVVDHAAKRAADFQLHLADRITSFAGSMPFVYLHAVAFTRWMLLVESDPWPRLTLAVSLEAIFLSAFVMIGQNRQAEFQQAKADHDFATEARELRLNTDLDPGDPRIDRRDPSTGRPGRPPSGVIGRRVNLRSGLAMTPSVRRPGVSWWRGRSGDRPRFGSRRPGLVPARAGRQGPPL